MQFHLKPFFPVCLFILLCSFNGKHNNDADDKTPGKNQAPFITYTVTNLGDAGPGTLRQAITLANNGTGNDVINITVTGTILLKSQLEIMNGVTINGPGETKCIISGNNSTRVFLITTKTFDSGTKGFIVNLKGFTIANGTILTYYDGLGAGIQSTAPGFIQGPHRLNIESCTFSGNRALGGGAIYYQTGLLSIKNCTFSNNAAFVAGGALSFSYKCGYIIENSTFADCRARNGGAITSYYGECINSTFTGNKAIGGDGGAIYCPLDNTTKLTNCTISGNSADGSGGGIYDSRYSPMIITNTIIAGNTAATAPDVYNEPGKPILSAGHNLIGKTDGSAGWTSTDITGTIASPVDPKLGPLGNNGGPTATMAISTGSPAVDAGALICPTITDQRGKYRPQGISCDIGAYEFENKLVVKFPPNNFDKFWRIHLWGPYLNDLLKSFSPPYDSLPKIKTDPELDDISILSLMSELSVNINDKETKEIVETFLSRMVADKIKKRLK